MATSEKTMKEYDGEAWKVAVMFHDHLEKAHPGTCPCSKFLRTAADVEVLWGAILHLCQERSAHD